MADITSETHLEKYPFMRAPIELSGPQREEVLLALEAHLSALEQLHTDCENLPHHQAAARRRIACVLNILRQFNPNTLDSEIPSPQEGPNHD